MDGTGRWVIVVEDDPSVRKAMRRLFMAHGFQVAAYACAGHLLGAPPIDHQAACLILDVRLPDLDGLELQARLQAQGWNLPAIFISAYGDIHMATRAMKNGAVDFLPKPVQDADLLEAVDEALRRDCEQKGASRNTAAFMARLKRLTPREYQVLTYLIGGLLNKQVAFALGISEKTVKVHRARIMAKAEVCSLADLVRLCEQARIPPAPSIVQYR